MVDYLRFIPVDIQEMIWTSYFKRHVLKDMVDTHFPHLSGVSSFKEHQAFKERCVSKYKQECKKNKIFVGTTALRISGLLTENAISGRNNKYSTFMDVINAISENETTLGMFFDTENDLFHVLQKILCTTSCMKSISPYYYILFFNEIPVNPNFRGCY